MLKRFNESRVLTAAHFRRSIFMRVFEASGHRVVHLIILLIGVAPALAQTKPPAGRVRPTTATPKPQPAFAEEESRLKRYLDKDGGYKDKLGGYYNPAAGTYTDKDGGIVDNWGGYIYKDGSYKDGSGDYYDAPTNTLQVTTGKKIDVSDNTSAEVIKRIRGVIKEHGGYDENFIYNAMLAKVHEEHPFVPAKAQHQ